MKAIFAATAAMLIVPFAASAADDAQTCTTSCWTLRVEIIDLPDKANLRDYRIDVTLGEHDRPVALVGTGTVRTVKLPRVLDAKAGQTRLEIALNRADANADPIASVLLMMPGYVRAREPLKIFLPVQGMPAINESAVRLDAMATKADLAHSSDDESLWRAYFQAERLLPAMTDRYNKGILRRAIFNACSKFARDTATFFSFADNDCQEPEDDPDVTEDDRDNVAMAPWLLFDYCVGAMNTLDGVHGDQDDYRGVYNTLDWLRGLRTEGQMNEKIETHKRLKKRNTLPVPPVPDEKGLDEALAKAKCKAGLGCTKVS